MSLSSLVGTKIAVIKKAKKTIPLFLNPQHDVVDDKLNEYSDVPIDVCNDYIKTLRLKEYRLQELKRCLRNSVEPTRDEELKLFYLKCQDIINSQKSKLFEIQKSDKGQLFPVPSGYYNLFVSGASGAGKSFFISQWLTDVKKASPKSEIYVFSKVQDDPAYKPLKPIYIKLDESIVIRPLECSEFAGNSESPNILVFDDTEQLNNKLVNKALFDFMSLALETGRHTNLRCVVVSHILLNNNFTKRPLNESNYITLFPNSNFSAIRSYLHRYLGYTKEQINVVRDMGKKSRWVMISRAYPQYIVSQYQVKLM
jgi:hypothetical protein